MVTRARTIPFYNMSTIKVEKIECVNHTVKSFNKAFHLMVMETKDYLLEHFKLLKLNIIRMGIALCYVIKHNSQDQL